MRTSRDPLNACHEGIKGWYASVVSLRPAGWVIECVTAACEASFSPPSEADVDDGFPPTARSHGTSLEASEIIPMLFCSDFSIPTRLRKEENNSLLMRLLLQSLLNLTCLSESKPSPLSRVLVL